MSTPLRNKMAELTVHNQSRNFHKKFLENNEHGIKSKWSEHSYTYMQQKSTLYSPIYTRAVEYKSLPKEVSVSGKSLEMYYQITVFAVEQDLKPNFLSKHCCDFSLLVSSVLPFVPEASSDFP